MKNYNYELTQSKSENDLKYFFISKGAADVVKAIQYSFVQKMNGKDVYNLGFGDYDIVNDSINDSISSNNGDAYKVFNTVLYSIPTFFENYPEGIVMVQGSDGAPEFEDECRAICKKKCMENCKNFNRRLNIYKGYIDKHYDELLPNYEFFGGTKGVENQVLVENYVCRKNYDSVFLSKKKG